MRILFDSRQEQYKTPFGTLRAGNSCVLHMDVPESSGATSVTLVMENCDEQPCCEFTFEKERVSGVYTTWRCEFTMQERGLYFYWFRIGKRDGSFRLFRQGDQTNMEAGEKWQLSIIPQDFTVPDYARGAVMYQISSVQSFP